MEYFEILRVFLREIESPDPLDLDKDFYKKALGYIGSLPPREEYEGRALRKTLGKLFLMRIEKLLKYHMKTSRFPEVSLPSEEEEVIRKIKEFLEIFESRGIAPRAETAGLGLREEGVLVFFLKPYSKIAVEGGRVLGPFSKGDLAYIPRKIADSLESDGIVEILE